MGLCVTLPRAQSRGMTSAHDCDTPAAADIRALEAADPRKSLSRKECQTEGNWGASSQRVKEQSGVLHRYLDGSSVRITAKSFYAHLIDLANLPQRQGRKPSGTSFQKKPRTRTPAELEGLKRNEGRHEEKIARERREDKQATRV
jgi:hypothetical protein